jgi:hypothetical protein
MDKRKTEKEGADSTAEVQDVTLPGNQEAGS